MKVKHSMNAYLLLFSLTLPFLWGMGKGDVVFQSQELQKLNLTALDEVAYILDDKGDSIQITSVIDEKGLLYWHRKLETEVCLTGECKVVNVGIYWYGTGEFMGLEVYGEQLTKTDHSVFSREDYDQLIAILQDDWSALREYEFEELLDAKPTALDGVTGATRKEIADEAVKGAVYTTYTLWHLIHEGEKEQLRSLMAGRLNQGDGSLLDALSMDSNRRYRYFLLELYGAGKLKESETMKRLILGGVTNKDDRYLSEQAFKALMKVNFNDPAFQLDLARVYPDIQPKDKVRVLNALGTGIDLTAGLYNSLILDLPTNNEWFAAKIIETVKNYPKQAESVLNMAGKLAESENSDVKRIALDFKHVHRRGLQE